jgi:dienelactone hydrolase
LARVTGSKPSKRGRVNEGLGFAKFMPYPFEERLLGRTVPLYTARPRGSRPVVVLHGSRGASPAFFRFAYRLADEGFSVYAPVLLGKPGAQLPLIARAGARALPPRVPDA